MSHDKPSVNTLFNFSMTVIIDNIHLVESFAGLPELIGEQIFQKFALQYSENCSSKLDVLKTFVETYGCLVLERLNLHNSLIILNEHFEATRILASCLRELCLCECYLGESHEILSHISEFRCLKKLCMRNNCLNDASMRLLTLRIRMYQTGGEELEYLDLEDNPLTDDVIPWLKAFPKLEFLNLSGSQISVRGIESLAHLYNLKPVSWAGEHGCLPTEGWAKTFYLQWTADCLKEREKKKQKSVSSLKKTKAFLSVKLAAAERSKSAVRSPSVYSLVFKKSEFSEPIERTTKKRKLSAICDTEIETDVFSQYM